VKRALAILLLAWASPGLAQGPQATLAPYYVFGDYREQVAGLRFRGTGGGVAATVTYRRWSVDGRFERLNYSPLEKSSGLAAFDASQSEFTLRYRAASRFSALAGVRRRKPDPGDAAQEVGSLVLGVQTDLPLGAGTAIAGRAAYLAFSDFSGGGSAPFGVSLGLGVTSSPGPRWLRLAGDFDFERLDRRTDGAAGTVNVPIQVTTARLGISVLFGRE
jgi:hypothetical protein